METIRSLGKPVLNYKPLGWGGWLGVGGGGVSENDANRRSVVALEPSLSKC